MSLEKEVAEYVIRIIQIEKEKSYQLGYTKGRMASDDMPLPPPSSDGYRACDTALADVKAAYAQYMGAILELSLAKSKEAREEAKACFEDASASLAETIQHHRKCVQKYL